MKHILIGIMLLLSLSCCTYEPDYQKTVIIKYAEGGWRKPQGTYVRVVETGEIILFKHTYLGEKGDTITVDIKSYYATKQTNMVKNET